MAEQWLLHHCALANADATTIQDARYKGKGHFCLTEKYLNPKKKDVSNSGDVVDSRLASASKNIPNSERNYREAVPFS